MPETTHSVDSPSPEWLAQVREHRPEATEAEAQLLEYLTGALGMIRMLTAKRGSTYTIGNRYDKDGYEIINDFLEATYGWRLTWRKPEPQKVRRGR